MDAFIKKNMEVLPLLSVWESSSSDNKVGVEVSLSVLSTVSTLSTTLVPDVSCTVLTWGFSILLRAGACRVAYCVNRDSTADF